MLNIFSALFIFAATINALTITSPNSGSRYAVGSQISFFVINTPNSNDTATQVSLTLYADGGRQQVVYNIPVETTTLITLSNDLVGSTALVAVATTGSADPGTSNIFIYKPAPIYPYYPCYNPCYNPCYTPRNCYVPRGRCDIPRGGCNIPRPRCRIRAVDASESSDAVEFIQSDAQPEILYSGFAIFVANDAEDFEDFESQQQEQQEQVVADQQA